MSSLQEILALVIVLIAAGYLAHRVWLIATRQRIGGCGTGGCEQCPSSASEPSDAVFISLEELK